MSRLRGQDGRIRLARPNSNGDKEIFIFPVQLTTKDWQPYPVDPDSAIYVTSIQPRNPVL